LPTGRQVDEPLPWHSTLSRTRQLYGEELDSLFEKDILDDADNYAGSLNEDEPSPAVKNIPNQDDKPSGNTTVSSRKNKEVQWHHAWKQKAYKDQPGARNQTEGGNNDEEKFLPKFVSNHTHYSTTDPDARVSVKPGKPRQLNYLSQVSVDATDHVITNIEAHRADKKGSQCLPAVIDHTV
jgi:hypothetical protein